ncbi:MAG: DUF481 domain-containing protein [Planctomycetes bacterium]|nr:DUF481 domain-containing protein [Planctomycetota bacterium]
MPITPLILALAPLAPFSAGAEPSTPPAALSLQDKPPMNVWTGAVNASAIFTDGNTETRSANAAADAQYRREHDRTTLGAFWNYQDDKSGVLQRRTGARAQYDYFFSEKNYAFAQTSIENDKQADLARRWILGAGAGRQFIEDAVHKVSAELGLSWFDEHFNNSADHDFFAARGAYKWDWVINKAWTFFHGAEIYRPSRTSRTCTPRWTRASRSSSARRCSPRASGSWTGTTRPPPARRAWTTATS